MVLYPGTSAPLHLFEPRYRQMLKDVQAADGCFGIMCAMPGIEERALPPGRVGCVAEVTEAETLDDGRSNILVTGRQRFVLDAFVDHEAPYHVASVSFIEDDTEFSPVALAVSSDEVVSNFKRIVRAVQTLNDEDRSVPTLPDDGAQLSFAIAAMIDFDLADRQAVLSERSPLVRLQRVDGVLRKVLPDLELRAAMHEARRVD
jgi:ATP-dependent Lon protease